MTNLNMSKMRRCKIGSHHETVFYWIDKHGYNDNCLKVRTHV